MSKRLNDTKLTAEHCRQKYNSFKRTVGPWEPAEDAALVRAVRRFGNNWSAVAGCLPGRNGKQARERYTNVLGPRMNPRNMMFTKGDDSRILAAFKRNPFKWKTISEEAAIGKTASAIKARYYAFIKPSKNGTMTNTKEEEDDGSQSLVVLQPI